MCSKFKLCEVSSIFTSTLGIGRNVSYMLYYFVNTKQYKHDLNINYSYLDFIFGYV